MTKPRQPDTDPEPSAPLILEDSLRRLESPEAFLNRELSWLAFARRVLELTQDPDLPLLERVKFVGILGMLHDEFFMKRIGGLKRQVRNGVVSRSIDGRGPAEELSACREEIRLQMAIISRVMNEEIRPAMRASGIPIMDYSELGRLQETYFAEYFVTSVLPLLTPLAVDAEHPFPFISGLGLNLGILVTGAKGRKQRFVRLKIPANHRRWLPVPGAQGFVPLEQVITANLAHLLPGDYPLRAYLFSVTRGAEAQIEEAEDAAEDSESLMPGGIIEQVTRELKARRFAGIVRLMVESEMPPDLRDWLCEQLRISSDDVYATETFLSMSDLLTLRVSGREDLLYPPHDPVIHPRLRVSRDSAPVAIFDEIARADILLHHPYQSFDASVLRFIEEAAVDPRVVAIKLTIYRTSSDSPIIRALVEAARRGKQVAVLVEITARFDEAPNIAWGQLLEKEGVHVAYGVQRLKTHVKLALVVREEGDLRSYAHVGTGNYHTGTARIYEDLGVLTADPSLCRDVAALFNQLTGALPVRDFGKMIVAPNYMRARFADLIQREAEHARQGRPARIRAKMNQLQDLELIRQLYRAGQAGVEISMNVRGLCCLRPGVPGLSDNIEVFSVVGRFLEHGRIYEFQNGGDPEYFLGSADWMRRNLDRRVESIMPVEDAVLKRELCAILDVYAADNISRWDCQPDGTYRRRCPASGEGKWGAQDVFIALANAGAAVPPPPLQGDRRPEKGPVEREGPGPRPLR